MGWAWKVGVHWKQISGYRVSWAVCVKSWPYIHTHTDTQARAPPGLSRPIRSAPPRPPAEAQGRGPASPGEARRHSWSHGGSRGQGVGGEERYSKGVTEHRGTYTPTRGEVEALPPLAPPPGGSVGFSRSVPGVEGRDDRTLVTGLSRAGHARRSPRRCYWAAACLGGPTSL